MFCIPIQCNTNQSDDIILFSLTIRPVFIYSTLTWNLCVLCIHRSSISKKTRLVSIADTIRLSPLPPTTTGRTEKKWNECHTQYNLDMQTQQRYKLYSRQAQNNECYSRSTGHLNTSRVATEYWISIKDISSRSTPLTRLSAVDLNKVMSLYGRPVANNSIMLRNWTRSADGMVNAAQEYI